MQVAIPLLALGGIYIASNQNKNKESTHRSLRQKQQEEQQKLTIDTQQLSDKNQQSSPLSSKSETTNVQHVQPRAPVLSASDAYHQSSFIRGVCFYLIK